MEVAGSVLITPIPRIGTNTRPFYMTYILGGVEAQYLVSDAGKVHNGGVGVIDGFSDRKPCIVRVQSERNFVDQIEAIREAFSDCLVHPGQRDLKLPNALVGSLSTARAGSGRCPHSGPMLTLRRDGGPVRVG
jgi:hypothetical protein